MFQNLLKPLKRGSQESLVFGISFHLPFSGFFPKDVKISQGWSPANPLQLYSSLQV